ncbi:hypothetical protein ANN_11314 [Periplaneta americana]|uniref:Uncharacterized protein n=1 Tax=Periplaneta americana TaxID=6978 RepID=A0ABQ8T4P0_PERAM|nr:hypothetical protein ANN_11314 [Periplaneta americana]
MTFLNYGADCCDPPEWSGSERDLAVPKKRRRRTDDDQEVESASLSSRSSSLLQFECLERHCEDVFRASASADPFPPPSPSVASNFSFDSLESQRWRFSASPDSLDSSSDDASSDDTLQHSSWSSRGSFRSSNGRLRSFRSVDSLNLLPRAPATETPRPAPQAPAASKSQRSAENLSEDSGFGDHCVTSSSARGSTVGTIVEDEDSCSSYYSDSSAGSSSETSEHETLKLKRGWGDEEAKFNSSCWQSAPSLLQGEEKKRRVGKGFLAVQSGSQQLSSVPDNLCLCSGDEDVSSTPSWRTCATPL